MATTRKSASSTAPEVLDVEFVVERETKGTFRFAEVVAAGADPVIGTLYVRKNHLATAAAPVGLSVTITVNR